MPRIADRSAVWRTPTPGSDAASYDLPEAAHMAHVIAHRLRGLVSGIEGFADLLLEQLGSAGQRDLAMRILESAHRIEHVLADLRYYTRPIEPVHEKTAIATLIGDLVETLPDEVAGRIRFDVALEAKRAWSTDPYLLREAILLLLQNAADATENDQAIQLRVADSEGELQIEVANPGRIERTHVPRIFDPFYTSKAQNLGVGLSMARRVVEVLGGRLSLRDDGMDSDCVRFEVCVPGNS